MLFVGDAVAAADPMTGEGIGQALQTGALAAEALLVAGPRRPGPAPPPATSPGCTASCWPTTA